MFDMSLSGAAPLSALKIQNGISLVNQYIPRHCGSVVGFFSFDKQRRISKSKFTRKYCKGSGVFWITSRITS
jgi:hypothetical protein